MLLYQSAFLWALYITFHLLKDGFFMDYIKYKTTLKASGDEYKKIVFWNRFVRNPVETILTWTPAAITIVLIVLGFLNTYLAVIYAACWAYPIYIFFFQFKSSVNYHLWIREFSLKFLTMTRHSTMNGIHLLLYIKNSVTICFLKIQK